MYKFALIDLECRRCGITPESRLATSTLEVSICANKDKKSVALTRLLSLIARLLNSPFTYGEQVDPIRTIHRCRRSYVYVLYFPLSPDSCLQGSMHSRGRWELGSNHFIIALI